MPQEVTRRATDDEGWAVNDPVVQLRVLGAEQRFTLTAGTTRRVLGAAADCDVRLEDPTGCISRHHAELTVERGAWIVRDLGSTNGIRANGERRLSFELAPGVEIGLGSVTLIAESEGSKRLRSFLSRIIGWNAARASDVDRALRAVREMATCRSTLVLCGAGPLDGVGRRIHDLALGDRTPFVVYRQGQAALDAASCGTLCMTTDILPPDLNTVVARPGTRLIVVAETRDSAAEAMSRLAHTTVVELPPLAVRTDDMERLILEYADDAAASLGADSRGFREHEMRWLMKLELTTLSQIEELAVRIVALRNWGVTGGAQRLGISHVALSRWAKRRRIPT